MGSRYVVDGEVIMGTESEEQMMIFRWAQWNVVRYPDLEFMYHTPNGGKRDVRTAKKLKLEGVKAGVPDICLPCKRDGYSGLYIELKVGKNKPTKEQKKYLAYLEEQGYKTMVCYGSKQAIWEIEKYLTIKEK